MKRINALKQFCQEPYGNRLAQKIKEVDFDQVVEFIEDHDDMGHLEFEYAINRMHLGIANKPKTWLIIQELLICTNSRAFARTTLSS